MVGLCKIFHHQIKKLDTAPLKQLKSFRSTIFILQIKHIVESHDASQSCDESGMLGLQCCHHTPFNRKHPFCARHNWTPWKNTVYLYSDIILQSTWHYFAPVNNLVLSMKTIIIMLHTADIQIYTALISRTLYTLSAIIHFTVPRLDAQHNSIPVPEP